jgi:hypothetical protein
MVDDILIVGERIVVVKMLLLGFVVDAGVTE